MLRRLPVALILAGLLAALSAAATPALADATTVSASGGGVTARLSYRGKDPNYQDLRLSITRAGATLYSGAVRAHACGRQCWPQITPGQRTVQVASLDGAGSADVLLNLFTGGAHCCSLVQVFRPSAALGGRYVESASHDFGDPGYELRTLGGQPAFVTADDAFAYAFTDYAASGLPIQILRLEGVRFVDITDQYPALVRTDAARWLRAYRSEARQRRPDSVGLLAAWAADEYRLGQASAARSYMAAQAAGGHVHSVLNPHVSGRRLVAQIETFLRKRGYATTR